MSSARPGVDLEKELTCSICTELLYQPLTLLDCLHTFCGSCLKDWFSWQKSAAETSPDPPSPGTQIFTCPSCRAAVRDTRHNATVTTLLEMFLAANPDKSKSQEEQQEMGQKYRPGDNVLPQVQLPDKSSEERRMEQMERRMLEQARDMSLRDIGVDLSEGSRRRREHSRETRNRDSGDRTRREGEHRRRAESNGMLSPDSSDERRRHRSESQHRSRDSSQVRRRHIEHQASIRSLISSSDVDSRDLEREIDDFARQIQEEGLLDGLDLDNIDLTRNDDLSRKITEAYRRRQRDRSRPEPSARRSNVSIASHRPEAIQSQSHSHLRPANVDALRVANRPRSNSAHTRPSSSTGHPEDRSRPPVTSTHLDVRPDPERRRRRRTSSASRSATDPVRPRTPETRPAARSQTDLTLRSQSTEPPNRRPSIFDSRSTSMPISAPGRPSTTEPPGSRERDLSFGGRATAAQTSAFPSPLITSAMTNPDQDGPNSELPQRRSRPNSAIVPQSPLPSLGLITSPTQASYHQRTRSHFYPEPSITCSRCQRPHIEYELHYNCSKCAGGSWNICLTCYRQGKGCLHWFGFGYAAFAKWERVREQETIPIEPLHLLTSNRYLPPKSIPGGAEGRRTLTTDDPAQRLESGMFCSRCLVWANECFWRCDQCNDGDWGFCNNCVNQGCGCTHPLLPLTYVAPYSSASSSPGHTPPQSPGIGGGPVAGRGHRRPRSAQLYMGPNAADIGNFKPLSFNTTCDICRTTIPPSRRRYHCFSCTSTVVPDTQPGDYDVCLTCYDNLVHEGRLSSENGYSGWRRCLNGHRMALIGFLDAKGGQKRYTVADLVGGRDLRTAPYDELPGVQMWWWSGPNQSRLQRLATFDVTATAPALEDGTEQFPPDGGVGMKGFARWAWFPKAGSDDELLLPKGAEVREIEDVNGDWYFGCYMGAKGLFPAPYVRV
ncbi:hypothetical protein F5Y15DRAFT_379205 [Xylariaceae sp. FL0016]|nr:hypothetical protein F5Y15DRAFT_379205 [Xylariaceae sp. FL0016]